MAVLFSHRRFTVVSADSLVGFDQELKQNPALLAKIKRSLDLSIEMTSAAYWALFNFESMWRISGDTVATDKDAKAVIPALLEYFQFDVKTADTQSKNKNMRMMDRIKRVYDLINGGLTLRDSTIVIGDMAGANGRIAMEQKRRTDVSPIRRNFGFTTEWQHKPWQMAVGDIELSVAYVRGGREDEIARTLVHEASHKFAQTKDILYKKDAFHKVAGAGLQDLIDLGDQAEVTLPGRAKKMLPMSGLERGTQDYTLVVAEHLLENADSYAWAARRIWKHRNASRNTA
jgi:hypothetical protein